MKLFDFVVIAVLIFVFYLMIPFLNVLIGGFLIAYLIYPLVRRFGKKIGSFNIASLVFTLLSFVGFVIMYYLLLRAFIFSFAQFDLIRRLNSVESIIYLAPYATTSSTFLFILESFFFLTPKSVVDFFILPFIIYYSLDLMHNYNKYTAPYSRSVVKFLHIASSILKSIIVKYVVVGLLIGATTYIVLLTVNTSYVIELSTLSFVLEVFPASTGVLIPIGIAFYYLIHGKLFESIYLISISIVLLLIRHILNNMMHFDREINPLLMIFGIIAGIKIMGLFGFIAGPILLGLAQAMYETKFRKALQ